MGSSEPTPRDEPRKQIVLTVQPQAIQHDERPRRTPGPDEMEAGKRCFWVLPFLAVDQEEDADGLDLLVEFGEAAIGREWPQRPSAWGVTGIDGFLEVCESAVG